MTSEYEPSTNPRLDAAPIVSARRTLFEAAVREGDVTGAVTALGELATTDGVDDTEVMSNIVRIAHEMRHRRARRPYLWTGLFSLGALSVVCTMYSTTFDTRTPPPPIMSPPPLASPSTRVASDHVTLHEPERDEPVGAPTPDDANAPEEPAPQTWTVTVRRPRHAWVRVDNDARQRRRTLELTEGLHRVACLSASGQTYASRTLRVPAQREIRCPDRAPRSSFKRVSFEQEPERSGLEDMKKYEGARRPITPSGGAMKRATASRPMAADGGPT